MAGILSSPYAFLISYLYPVPSSHAPGGPWNTRGHAHQAADVWRADRFPYLMPGGYEDKMLEAALSLTTCVRLSVLLAPRSVT